MKNKLLSILTSAFLLNSVLSEAQTTNKIIVPAVPFLAISPDSRGAALGDAGVASSPDAYSLYWNTAKLAFIEKNKGASLNYTPWLRDLVDDMAIIHATAYKKAAKGQAFGLAVTYFNQGQIDFTTNAGQAAGSFQSRDLAITGGYTRKISRDIAMGLNLKYIYSNLIGAAVVNNQASKPANTVAGDLSVFYMKDKPSLKSKDRGMSISAGAVLSNIGGKVNYGRAEYFLPTTFKVGTNLGFKLDATNRVNVLLDLTKLMVSDDLQASAINSVFNSFSDFSRGTNASMGVEYWYEKIFAARAGYFAESTNNGGRKYATMGLGFRLKDTYGIDLAYLIPTVQGSPLANTWRISLVFDLDVKKVSTPTEEASTTE
jgi:hypothetical protein